MPIVIILLLAAMVATFGFWGTLKGIIGALGVIVLLVFLAVFSLALFVSWIARR